LVIKPAKKSKAKAAREEAIANADTRTLADAAAFNAKAPPAPEPTPEPEAPVAAGGFTTSALAALAEPISAPELDPAADRRAKKTLAQRSGFARAAAKASVQWRGDAAMTAAAAE
jgi:hypothetical protein